MPASGPSRTIFNDDAYDAFLEHAKRICAVEWGRRGKSSPVKSYIDVLDGDYVHTDPQDDVFRTYPTLAEALVGEDLNRIEEPGMYIDSAELGAEQLATILYTPLVAPEIATINGVAFTSDGTSRKQYSPDLPVQFHRIEGQADNRWWSWTKVYIGR